MNNSISIYGSHDSSICVNPRNDLYRIYEFERLLGQRYCKINDNPDFEEHCKAVKNEINKEYSLNSFDKCYYGQLNDYHLEILKRVFNIKNFIETKHHYSHAACAFYQSDFKEAITVSYDGGGHDLEEGVATFKIFYCNKDHNEIKLLHNIEIDVGNSYSLMAIPISEIKKNSPHTGYDFLAFAGKLMGLAAYGNIRPNWVPEITKFFLNQGYDGNLEQLRFLFRSLKLGSRLNPIRGQLSYDLAATAQHVFSNVSMSVISPIIENYKLPICVTGGCALNVLFNQQLKDNYNHPIFIPPNPNDCGLSFGQMVLNEPPSNHVNIMYNGFGILDIEKLSDYVENYNAINVSLKEVAELLANGKIIGVVNGNSEVGPRALGNRSILCDPSYKNMKDDLNLKVKFREWFRPFAPIVRLEETNKYFNFNDEAKFMSFAPKVKEEWRDKLPAITHIDGTSRVQTVKKEDNEFLYKLLTEFNSIKNIGVLLNTSFNIKGKPILTKIEDAILTLEETELDYVLIEGFLFKKRR